MRSDLGHASGAGAGRPMSALITRRALVAGGALAICALVPAPARAETVVKKFTPRVSKRVRAGDGTWVAARSVASWGEAEYRITVGLPDGVDALADYPLSIVDDMDPLLYPVSGSVKVVLARPDGTDADVTGAFDVQVGTHGVTARAGDIAALLRENGSHGPLHVFYRARVRAAACGTDDPMNNFCLAEFRESVGDKEMSRTPEARAHLVSWALAIKKVSADDGRALPGAHFSVRRESDGAWLLADGSAAKQEAYVVTDRDGVAHVRGTGTGAFLIKETQAPDGFKRLEGSVRVEIADDVSEDVATVTAKVTSGTAAIEGADAASGTVTVRVADEEAGAPAPAPQEKPGPGNPGAPVAPVAGKTEKRTPEDTGGTSRKTSGGMLPKTGDDALATAGIAGIAGIAAVAGGVAAARRRKDQETDEG